MSPRPFGVGIGLILLTALWTVCLLSCVIASRKRGIQFGIVYPFLASLLTILLLVWPREQCQSSTTGGGGVGLDQNQNGNPNVDDTAAMIDQILRAESSEGSATNEEHQPEIDWLAIPRLSLSIVLIVIVIFAAVRQLKDTMFKPAPAPPKAPRLVQ